MYEYKIVQIKRSKEEKTKEVEVRRGKTETQKYIEIEPFADFYARAEKNLNDWATDGWQVITMNYSLPIKTESGTFASSSGETYTSTDFNSAEFVAVLQRSK